MEVKFNCTNCRRKVGAEQELIGVRVLCPACDAPLFVPEPHYNVGEKLGDFRIEQWLGSGAMGEVYLAIQEPMGTEVALKILSPEMAMDDDIERFQQEVRLLARITHPNVVTAVQAGEQDGKHYLAMSYVDGENVEEQVEREGPLKESEVLRIGLQVAQALEYSWDEVQLLHRDVKPANIMIDGKNGQVKLMDMGIAKSGSLDANLTMSGMLLGTPHYMSPEQARGLMDVDPRSDIYALGATLFHLLVGEPAHEAESALDVLSRKLNEEPPDVRLRNAAVSEATAILIQRMMALEREGRAANWTDQVVEIKQAMEGIVFGSQRAQDTVDEFIEEEEEDDPHAIVGAPAASTKPAEANRKQPRKNLKRSSHHRRNAQVKKSGASTVLIGLAVGGLAALLLIIMMTVANGKKKQQPPAPVPPKTSTTTPAPSPPPPAPIPPPDLDPDVPSTAGRLQKLRTRMEEIAEFERANREDYEGILERLYPLARDAKHTKLEDLVGERIRQAEGHRDDAKTAVMGRLYAEVTAMLDADRFDDAITHLQNYHGPFVGATAIARQQGITQIREKQEAFQAGQNQQEQRYRIELDTAYLGIAQQLLSGGANSALGQIRRLATDAKFRFAKDEITLVGTQVNEAARMPTMVRESLERQIGREIPLRISSERKILLVSAVTHTELHAKERISERGMMGTRYRLSDISVNDKLARIRAMGSTQLAVLESILAVEAKAYDTAEKIFTRIEGPLSIAFDATLSERLGKISERQAELAFRRLLEANRLNTGAKESDWSADLSNRLKSGKGLSLIRQSAREFLDLHGDSELATRYASLLGRMTTLRGETWPASDLAFFFSSTLPAGAPRSEILQSRGTAKVNPANELAMRGGAHLASSAAAQRVLDACRRSNELSIELIFASESTQQTGLARILSFSQDGFNRNFTIGQEGSTVVLRLRTSENGANGTNFSPVLCSISSGRHYHLLVSYRTGELNCYLDGNRVYSSQQLTGDLSNWASMHLLFGNEYQEDHAWSGLIRACSIYSRAIDPAQAASQYQNYLQLTPNGVGRPRRIQPKPGKGRFEAPLERRKENKGRVPFREQPARAGVPDLDSD